MEINIGNVKCFTHKGSIEAGVEAINLHAAEVAMVHGVLVEPISVQYLPSEGKTIMWYQFKPMEV